MEHQLPFAALALAVLLTSTATSPREISKMKQRFGKRVHSVDITRADGDGQGVHDTASNKRKITEEVLVDIFIAKQSKHFFCMSFFSCSSSITLLGL